jgi:hypothetical protein
MEDGEIWPVVRARRRIRLQEGEEVACLPRSSRGFFSRSLQ